MIEEQILVAKTANKPSADADAGTETVDAERRRGRGARSNHTGRFEAERREEVDDGWEGLGDTGRGWDGPTGQSCSSACSYRNH